MGDPVGDGQISGAAEAAPGVEGTGETQGPVTVWARARRVLAILVTVVAFLLVWAAMVFPNRPTGLHVVDFLRVPLEGLLLVAVSLVLPTWPRRVVAGIGGFLLGIVVLLKILDIVFYEFLDRPFNLLLDWSSFKPGVRVLRDSIGAHWAHIVVLGIEIASVAIVVLVTLASIRVAEAVSRHRSVAGRVAASTAVVWVACAATAAQVVSGAPLASASSIGLAADEVVAVHDTIHDEQVFKEALASRDTARAIPRRTC